MALPPPSGTLASLVGHLTSTVAGSTLAVEHGASADSTAEGATASFEELVALIEAGRPAEMLEADQLRRALQHGDVLSGFTEGNVAAYRTPRRVFLTPALTSEFLATYRGEGSPVPWLRGADPAALKAALRRKVLGG